MSRWSGTPTLAGRAEELAVLSHAHQQARAGQGQVVAIIGDAGIGKSALLRQYAATVPSLVGRTTSSDGPAWGPLAGVAAELLDRGADPSARLLGAYAPALELLRVGQREQDATLASAHPLNLAEALVRLWATLPVPQRPLLCIEDVHWCDAETWAVLERWVERAPALGLMLVVTARPEGQRWPALEHFLRGRLVRGLRLEPLERDAVAVMVGGSLSVDPANLPPELMARLAAGNGWPLLVEELLDDLLRRGVLTRTTHGWELSGEVRHVPATVEAQARERLEWLSDDHRAVVRRAAVMGEPLDNAVLARSLALDTSQLGSALHAAAEVGIFSWDSALGRGAFRHELLRESVVGAMLDVEREEHARALLAALELPTRPTNIDDWTRSLTSGQLALARRLAAWTSDADLRALLELTGARDLLAHGSLVAAADAGEAAAELGTGVVRAEAWGLRAEAPALSGRVDQALAAVAGFEAVAAASGGFGDADLRSRVGESVVRATTHTGDWERAQRLLDPLRSPDEPATTTSLAAVVALELGRLGPAREEAERAATSADDAAACEAMEVLGRLSRGNDLEAAEGWFRRAAERARKAGLGFWHAHAAHELATIAQLRYVVVAPLHEARDIATTAGAPGLLGAVDFHIAALHGVRFEPEEALVAARRLLSEARSVGAVRQEAWAWILVGQAQAVAGHRAQAEQAGREAGRLCPEDPEILGMASGCCAALAALLMDDTEVGVRQWQEGVRQLRELPEAGPLPPWYLWPVLATVLDLEGDGGERARVEVSRSVRPTPGAEALWHLACAAAVARTGDVDEANRENARAEELFAQVPPFGGWWHLAHRWVALQAAQTGWGDPAAWMVEAQQFFADHELHQLAATCRSLARKAGAPQRRRGRGSSDVPAHLAVLGVTAREVDVLRLVASGLTNKQIAERLFLSPRTVKGYVEQLLAKTSSTNRTKLATHLDP